MITNRLTFPRNARPEPDVDLDITNRMPFDAYEGAVAGGLEPTANPSTAQPSYFPFPDEPATQLPKPWRPKGTQGKDYHLPELLRHWHPTSYTAVQNALRKISINQFMTDRKYDEQTEGAKDEYLRQALQEFPFLVEYEEGWPAIEFAKMYLKNTSDAAKAGRKKNRG